MNNSINWHNMIQMLACVIGGIALIYVGHTGEGAMLLGAAAGISSPGMPTNQKIRDAGSITAGEIK